MADSRAVGVFDSGVGGLTVLHECLVTMPNEDFVYLGDHAPPYGPRPSGEVRRFAHEAAPTSSSQGKRKDGRGRMQHGDLRRSPRAAGRALGAVVGVITPEAHAAVQATRNRRIGLLATELTVASGRYDTSVRTSTPAFASHPVAVPEARAADRGRRPVRRRDRGGAVREYAAPLKAAGVDTVILGCTHYPLIRPILQRVFGRDVTLVFSAEETAREVAETLARKGFEKAVREGSYRFLTTGDPELFRALGERFLQLPIGEVEHVAVAELEAAA